MQDFCHDERLLHIAAKSTGVAIQGSAERSRDGGSPFQAAQTAQTCTARDGTQNCAGFSPHGRRVASRIHFDLVRPVQNHHPVEAAVTDQKIGAAAEDEERHFKVPQHPNCMFQLITAANRKQCGSMAANPRGGIAGHWNIFLQMFAQLYAQLVNGERGWVVDHIHGS